MGEIMAQPQWAELRESKHYSMGHITTEEIKAEAAVVVVQLVYKNRGHITYNPGNATIYDMWIIDMWNGRHLVALPEFHTCFHFKLTEFLHPTYVQEKLPSLTMGDAACVAEFLMILGELLPA